MTQQAASPSSGDVAGEAVLYHEEERPWWLPILLLAFPLIPSFRRYHVTLTSATLEVGYVHGWTMARLERSSIASAAVVRDVSGLWEWGGYGIRARPARAGTAWLETGYIHRDGPGLRVEVRDDQGGRRFVTFNAADPDRLQRLLGVPETAAAAEKAIAE